MHKRRFSREGDTRFTDSADPQSRLELRGIYGSRTAHGVEPRVCGTRRLRARSSAPKRDDGTYIMVLRGGSREDPVDRARALLSRSAYKRGEALRTSRMQMQGLGIAYERAARLPDALPDQPRHGYACVGYDVPAGADAERRYQIACSDLQPPARSV